jgi:hypothetical protein
MRFRYADLGGLIVCLFLWQQVMRQIERVGNDCRYDGARDNGGDQRRILRLVDDAVRCRSSLSSRAFSMAITA